MKTQPSTEYAAALSLREARDTYFRRNGFDADGGYGKRWERMSLGPLVFYVPNSDGRVRALRKHDLHHVLTGYRTDWQGEFAISAWELGSGCKSHGFAWLINLGGLAAGLLRWPRDTYRAFLRGRHSGNLYRVAYDTTLLDTTVGAMKARLRLDQPPGAASAKDILVFLAMALLGMAVGAGWLLFLPLVLPYAALTAGLRRRDEAQVLVEERG